MAKVKAYYAGLKTFQVDISATLHVEMQGMKSEMTSGFSCAMEQPNRLALVMQTGMLGGTLVSDGKTCIVYYGMLGQYTKKAAPASFDDLLDPMSMTLVCGGYPLGLETIMRTGKATMYGMPVPAGMSEYIGQEKIEAGEADHVRMKMPGMITDFWFAVGDAPLLLQTTTTLDLPALLKNLPGDAKSKMPNGFQNMKSSRTATFFNWKLNQPIPDSAFTFIPPVTAKLVENFGGGKKKKPDEHVPSLVPPSPAAGTKTDEPAAPVPGKKKEEPVPPPAPSAPSAPASD
jgi:hypothetical protein